MAHSSETGTVPRVDLRSDLLARPTPDMRQAMADALGDAPAFELREDPRQIAFERRAAECLGTEDALLVPTCTMANQIALLLHARPGETALAQPAPHILTSEGGAPAAMAGVQVQAVGAEYRLSPPDWRAAMERATGPSVSRVALVSIENTHTRAGGRIADPASVRAVLALARQHGIAAHLDGARLINAAVALGVEPRDLAAGFDTVALSLNKGLGAPFGAVLGGSRAAVETALALRQRLGGGIRRLGPIAAAADVALRDVSHIADDHRRAQALALGLGAAPARGWSVRKPETNIVLLVFERAEACSEMQERLAAGGILTLVMDRTHLRLTTYRDIGDEDVAYVIARFRMAADEMRDAA